MALIVEDGTGLAGAESFCSVDAADTYHTARGNETAWTDLDSTVKEQHLRKASDYMEAVYRSNWDGYRVNGTQALSWPRHEVRIKDYTGWYPSDAVPAVVANACAELALRSVSGALAPDIKRQVKRIKVDVIETEYADGATPYTRFRAVDNMLEPFFGGASGMNIKIVRA
jgi:hypothetical protein